MPEELPYLTLILQDDVPEEVVAEFLEDVRSSGQPVSTESRPVDAYAGIEWYLPTAVILFITQSYFSSFLKEAGKDHYQVLKRSVAKLYSKFFGSDPEARISVVTSGEKKSQLMHSMAFSIVAQIEDGQTVKLILRNDTNEQEYKDSIIAFFSFLESYQNSKMLPQDAVSRWNMIIVEYNNESKELVFLSFSAN